LVRLLEPGEIPFAQQGAPANGVFGVADHLVKGHGLREASSIAWDGRQCPLTWCFLPDLA